MTRIRLIRILILFAVVVVFSFTIIPVYSQDKPTFVREAQQIESGTLLPVIRDTNFIVEEFVDGLNWPTTMAFVDDDILVLEKNTGKVRLVRNGVLVQEPVLQVNVNPISESGLLGILSQDSIIYLYYTEIDPETRKTIGNQVYKYIWNGEKLVEPELIQSLPWGGGTREGPHNGGVFTQDNEGRVFTVIGDIMREDGILQNYPSGEPDDTSVIFELESDDPYYSIGIRNSFGLAVDPITGNLWDTENGNKDNDEINLVEPKSNSGWGFIQGFAKQDEVDKLPKFRDFKYRDPEFSWIYPVTPTALTFVTSPNFEKYSNSLFVGDFLNGFLYKFNLNEDRTRLVFNDKTLQDFTLDNGDFIDEIIFGIDFGGITDLEFGPDGNLYVVSIIHGKIYRIIPSESQFLSSMESECDKAPRLRINWTGCDVSNLDLEGVDLRFADLRMANFENSNLKNAHFTLANLEGANMKNTNLESATLVVSNLTKADFSNSEISRGIFKYSDFTEANFENSIMKKSFLAGSNLKNANFKNVDLYDSEMRNTIVEDTSFENANLSEIDLRFSNYFNVNMKNANLTNTHLMDTDFINVNLQNTEMLGVILHRTNLTGSDLSGANLSNVFPYKTDFTNVTFSDKSLLDTCFGDNFFHWAINKILEKIRQIDSPLLGPLEGILVQMCRP